MNPLAYTINIMGVLIIYGILKKLQSISSHYHSKVQLAMRFLALFLILSHISQAWSCSIIGKNNSAMMKNFDWHEGLAEIYQVPAGIKKQSAFGKVWTSKFASLVFTQIGPHLPYGGVNERGLMIDTLVLGQKGANSQNPNFMESDWIAYQLDQYSNIDEVVENLKQNKIKTLKHSAHYFICDNSTCGVIEYIGEEANFYPRVNEYMTLTNSSYPKSLDALENPENHNLAATAGSLNRFIKLNQFVSPDEEYTLLDMFKVLEEVSLGALTQFKILYQTNSIIIGKKLNQTIELKTDFKFVCNDKIRYISNKENGQRVLNNKKIKEINQRIMQNNLPETILNRVMISDNFNLCH